MIVTDDALAQAYLNRIGYYRLSGYWYPYRIAKTLLIKLKSRINFEKIPNSEVVELYVFDKRLRLSPRWT
jgi:abortive infection bacteriophage resistance protein